ncbi:unnamed protein product [Ixodes pacificus]
MPLDQKERQARLDSRHTHRTQGHKGSCSQWRGRHSRRPHTHTHTHRGSCRGALRRAHVASSASGDGMPRRADDDPVRGHVSTLPPLPLAASRPSFLCLLFYVLSSPFVGAARFNVHSPWKSFEKPRNNAIPIDSHPKEKEKRKEKGKSAFCFSLVLNLYKLQFS